MKKLFMILGVVMLTASCMGPAGPQGPPGRDGVGVTKYVIDFTVFERDWRKEYDPNGLFLYWYYDIPVRELTLDVMDYGAMLAYVCNGDIQELMQTVVFNEYDGQPFQGKWAAEFSPGEVRVMYQESDFMNENVSPGTARFRIVLFE